MADNELNKSVPAPVAQTKQPSPPPAPTPASQVVKCLSNHQGADPPPSPPAPPTPQSQIVRLRESKRDD